MYKSILKSVLNKYKILIPLLISNYFYKNKTYQPDKKFIILSRSRTGSTMLINHLSKIPNSYVQSEMLRRKTLIPFWKKIPDLIFGNHTKKYQIAGFKCFYYHPIDDWDSNRFIYEYILSNPHIKVIHWRREDLFAVIISRYIADKTGLWAKTKKEPKLKPFYINENSFKYDLEVTLSQTRMIRNMFSKYKNYKEFTFEDIVERNKLNQLFDFLEVKVNSVNYTSKSKQNSEEKYKCILNIDNLKKLYNDKMIEYHEK